VRVRLVLAVLAALASGAHAEGLGLYAPAAPFSGPVARLDFVSGLAARLGPGLVGRAYAKATDFAAAVKRGEVSYAVVDVAYLAASGLPATVLAVAQRGGQSETPWEVVSSVPARALTELRGRSVALPSIGARDELFLAQVLLEGELGRDFFAHPSFAPDALSALAAVERGRAEVAIVPSGLALPAGVHHVATLRPLSWPALVALSGAPRGAELAAAAAAWHDAGAVLDGFAPASNAVVQGLAHDLTPSVARRAPLVTPPLRIAGAALLGGRPVALPLAEVTTYLRDPPPTNHR
jgi:hypothetical protein